MQRAGRGVKAGVAAVVEGDPVGAIHWPSSLRAGGLIVHDRTATSDQRWEVDLDELASFFTMALVGVAAVIRAEAAPELVQAACRVATNVLDCEASPSSVSVD